MSQELTPTEAIKQYYEQKPDFVKLWNEHLNQNPQNAKPTYTANMPVQPKEEETHGNLTDQVAKESSDSTASTHKLHQEGEQTKATIQDHHANLGPAISQNIGEPASKEELKKRSDELNKK